jgi:hypothetical protein
MFVISLHKFSFWLLSKIITITTSNTHIEIKNPRKIKQIKIAFFIEEYFEFHDVDNKENQCMMHHL